MTSLCIVLFMVFEDEGFSCSLIKSCSHTCSNISSTGSVSVYLEDMPVLVFDETKSAGNMSCVYCITPLAWTEKRSHVCSI